MRPLSGAILRVAEVHDVARVTDRPRAHSDLLLHAHALSQSICLGAAGANSSFCRPHPNERGKNNNHVVTPPPHTKTHFGTACSVGVWVPKTTEKTKKHEGCAGPGCVVAECPAAAVCSCQIHSTRGSCASPPWRNLALRHAA